MAVHSKTAIVSGEKKNVGILLNAKHKLYIPFNNYSLAHY